MQGQFEAGTLTRSNFFPKEFLSFPIGTIDETVSNSETTPIACLLSTPPAKAGDDIARYSTCQLLHAIEFPIGYTNIDMSRGTLRSRIWCVSLFS